MRKSRKDKRDLPKFYVRIERTESTTVTREARESEWDADDLDHSHTIHGYKIVGEKDMWDFILNEDPAGKDYYLVYVIYSTGDSFHHEEGCLGLVSFVPYLEDAKAILKAIEEDYRKHDDMFHTKVPTFLLKVKLPRSNRTETVYADWKGYFERLSGVYIQNLSEGMAVKF